MNVRVFISVSSISFFDLCEFFFVKIVLSENFSVRISSWKLWLSCCHLIFIRCVQFIFVFLFFPPELFSLPCNPEKIITVFYFHELALQVTPDSLFAVARVHTNSSMNEHESFTCLSMVAAPNREWRLSDQAALIEQK